jgi:hypothetical protein
MSKNLCGKMRKSDNPYEIWEGNGFTYKILKKYQSPEKEAANPYARWFCATTSPYLSGGEELGDGYVKDIKNNAVRTYIDPTIK